MTGTDATARLFFELSHPQRLVLLASLSGASRRLSELARETRQGAPEVSRHLARLSAQGLLERAPGGGYRLTGYGRLVVAAVDSLEGLCARRGFLKDHDLTVLPPGFASRLNELSTDPPGATFTESLRHVEDVLESAREFAWFMTDQGLLTADRVLSTVRRRRAAVRVLFPRSLLPPPGARGASRARDLPIEFRVLPEVKVALALNELVGGVCFAAPSGPIDYAIGFRGSSPRFRAWCQDLFEHYWRSGRQVRVW